jgi:DNA-binding transcriptional LysR family regulator
MGFARGELPQMHWASGKRKVPLDGAFFSNSPELLCRMAMRGQGITLVPAVVAAGPIARGELVLVLRNTLRVEGRVALVFPERELMPAQVRAFIDWMATRLTAFFQAEVPEKTAKPKARSANRRTRPTV